MLQDSDTILHAACKAGEIEAVRFLAKECDGVDLSADNQVHCTGAKQVGGGLCMRC